MTITPAFDVSFHAVKPTTVSRKAQAAIKKVIVATAKERPLLTLVLSLMNLLIILIVVCLEISFVVFIGVVVGGVWIVSMEMVPGPVRFVLACVPFCYVALISRSMAASFESNSELQVTQAKREDQWPAHV